MEEHGILFTLAEVAVAFVGFSSLVSILGRTRSRDDPRLDAIRMRGLIESSLLVVGGSLLPPILSLYPLSPQAVWRGAAFLFFAAGVTLSVLELLRARRLVAELREDDTPFRAWVGIPMMGTVLAALAVSAGVASGLLASGAALYVTALGLFLVRAGFAFALVLISLLGRRESNG